MKKNKLSLIAALSIASAITFNSCEKIEVGSPVTVNTSKTATISGMVHADLVLDKSYVMDNNFDDPSATFQTSDTLEYALEGTEIHFHITKQDLNSDVQDASDELRYSTTVNANGTYSIQIPTTEEGLDVNISFDDFEYNRITWNYDGQVIGFLGDTSYVYSSSSERKVYSCSDSQTEVYENQNVILDFLYSY
mgnify:CR=1 FL=1|tara:strand:- start:13630 stop:14208 length:579 start_codon:yes stop_codon:yes gene_type:complete